MGANFRDIAAAAGVSVASVSRALRGTPGIGDETRKRVRATAQRLGYEPDQVVTRAMRAIRRKSVQRERDTLAYLEEGPPEGGGKWDYAEPTRAGAEKRARELGYGFVRFRLDDPEMPQRRLSQILYSRGIRGVVIAPLHRAAVTLDWCHFATVAIGYTLRRPELHRVVRNVTHVQTQLYQRLVSAGFARIGFTSFREHESRMEHTQLSAYLLHDWMRPIEARVAPLVVDRNDPEALADWLKVERPDIVVGSYNYANQTLRAAGYRTPRDVSFLSLACTDEHDDHTGLYPDYARMGSSVIEQVSALVERGELGVPVRPFSVMVPDLFCPGATMRLKNGRRPRASFLDD